MTSFDSKAMLWSFLWFSICGRSNWRCLPPPTSKPVAGAPNAAGTPKMLAETPKEPMGKPQNGGGRLREPKKRIEGAHKHAVGNLPQKLPVGIAWSTLRRPLKHAPATPWNTLLGPMKYAVRTPITRNCLSKNKNCRILHVEGGRGKISTLSDPAWKALRRHHRKPLGTHSVQRWGRGLHWVVLNQCIPISLALRHFSFI